METLTDYINFSLLLPTEILRLYPSNKPWINSHFTKMITDTHRALKACNIRKYREKQTEVNKATQRVKVEYRDKVEQPFKSNDMKDAWKGLKALTGQKEGRKASSVPSTPGSADRLTSPYSRFANRDYSSIRQSQKSKLEECAIDKALIEGKQQDVYKVLEAINISKVTGPDEIRERIVEQGTTSLFT